MTHHVVPVRTYLLVFGTLLTLTLLTVLISRVELGPWNFAVAITIAAVKASLVAWYFMHLSQSSSLTRLFAVAGLIWLVILLTYTLSDYFTRGAVINFT